MNTKEILRRQPPETLYHYTNQSGILGIVGNKEIWASHTQYLNDASEFRHAVELVKEELSRMKLEPPLRDRTELLCEMEGALVMGIETINVCVCSFSARGDLLSQWRAYGGRASAFSIGFSGSFLRAISDKLDCWLVPVVYTANEQHRLVRTLLDDVLDENSRRRADNQERRTAEGPVGGNLVAYLNRYAPILKHESFCEECEWRIISRPLMCSQQRFCYREGPSTLVPYFKIPLSSGELPFRVEEIIVGPTALPEQSTHAINGFLAKHRLVETRVRNSATPYRNW
jgi:hypothetical protein